MIDTEELINIVVLALGDGGMTGPDVVEAAQKERPGVSRQAVYAALRKLLSKEIVYKAGKMYALNRVWAKELYMFASRQLEDIGKEEVVHITDLKEGDKMTYQFKNPYLMDIYWGHIFDALMEVHDTDIPVIVYHPHEWFYYARPDTERAFLRGLRERGNTVFFAVGGDTPLDKAFRDEWQSDDMQVSCGNMYGFKPGYHMNVIGDFVFEVFVESGFAHDIDRIFKENASDAPERLKEAAQRSYRTKLVFTKDAKKAKKLRNKVIKDFYVPADIRERWLS